MLKENGLVEELIQNIKPNIKTKPVDRSYKEIFVILRILPSPGVDVPSLTSAPITDDSATTEFDGTKIF